MPTGTGLPSGSHASSMPRLFDAALKMPCAAPHTGTASAARCTCVLPLGCGASRSICRPASRVAAEADECSPPTANGALRGAGDRRGRAGATARSRPGRFAGCGRRGARSEFAGGSAGTPRAPARGRLQAQATTASDADRGALPGLFCWALNLLLDRMLEPTSESFEARSVEWVRADVPLGDSPVDEVEHVYYTVNAPRKEGRALKALLVVGLHPLTAGAPRSVFVRGRRRSSRLRVSAAGRGGLAPDGPAIDGGPPVLVTTFRPEPEDPQMLRLRRLVRPHAHGYRLLPGPLRAAERRRARADDGPRRPALAPARHLQRRLHLRRRRQRLDRQRPRNEPLKDGLATLVGYRDGAFGSSTGAADRRGPDVAWARQSLAPILWNGQPNPS